jgi:APA family basic amino acid/polyamine antiporter
MSFLTRRKSIDAMQALEAHEKLIPTLSWPHLMALGVGAIVGTGIYTLVGVASGMAGPAVMLSFVAAGLVCICAALAYAEMATMIPVSGSAYTYSYAVMGEGTAWVVGWSLILEYTVVCSAVAVGWSGHAAEFLRPLGMPAALLAGPFDGGLINLPAVVISLVVTGLLVLGTRESATVNAILVAVKIVALVVFVALALPHFQESHFHPFMTHGWFSTATDPQTGLITKLGVLPAAAIIFFAFYGFDTISTAAEETKNPARDLKIGIVGSMIACTIIYMVVAAAAVGAVPVAEFAKDAAPLVFVMNKLGAHGVAGLVAGAAVVALPTVILAFLYGQSRIFFVMARDGLLPTALSKVSARTGGPVLMTVFTGVLVAILSGFVTLGELASVANAGTLAAFIAVCVAMMILRVREPNRPRVFRAPLWWLIGPAGVVGCLGLFAFLSTFTQIAFLVWNAIGIVFYLAYGRGSSVLGKAEAAR